MAVRGNRNFVRLDFVVSARAKQRPKCGLHYLRDLLLSGEDGPSKIKGWCDGGLYFEDNQDVTLNSQSDTLGISSFDEVSLRSNTNLSSLRSYTGNTMQVQRFLVAWDQTNTQLKGTNSDAFHNSISCLPSPSSHCSASAPDDDALGDVYIWGEVICDGPQKNGSFVSSAKVDVLVPRPLESNVVLDAHVIACGVRHAALVTRQGEIFTWGEESGGHLGHGVADNVTHPRLVEYLGYSSINFVACGEFHTCAVTSAGELYTWGDGAHKVGLLGNDSGISHWVPKRISGPLEGLKVATIACGPWHTALVTSSGRLFTFGDGTFGMLGHGDRESVSSPREVPSLSGLRSIAVSCGVWHTAAVVSVIVTASSASVLSGKLFTWGDGDKNRLGHGDKDPLLEPTCVSTLIEYDFIKIACGHSLTVGLTTSGQVITMGSSVYGQLRNPECDRKAPWMVQDKLKGVFVEEVACGAYHVAVLTNRNEVYTWGKGANGRLGHGDVEDRKIPTLVETLKDRYVKYIACGSNYSAAICIHKWVSGTEQAQCSGCRQVFGFTRKRHNCYNCGLVHCHSCSSRKALRATLSPDSNKPYRVCDSCFSKLNKVAETYMIGTGRRNGTPCVSGENKDIIDKLGVYSKVDIIKQLDSRVAKRGKKGDVSKPVFTQSAVNSRSVSPFSRKNSPPRSATPVSASTGISVSIGIMDGLKKSNELLNQEVQRLHAQVNSLRQRCEIQVIELQNSTRKAQESTELLAQESSKSKSALELIKSLTAQLKDMAENLPPEAYDASTMRVVNLPKTLESNGNHRIDTFGSKYCDSIKNSQFSVEPTTLSAAQSFDKVSRDILNSNRTERRDAGLFNGADLANRVVEKANCVDEMASQVDGDTRTISKNSESGSDSNHVEAEWIEQYEPGVYITLVALKDGTRYLKRVRFSRRRFGEHKAETWWSENREKVYERYNVRGSDKSSVSGQTTHRSEGGLSPSSHQVVPSLDKV